MDAISEQHILETVSLKQEIGALHEQIDSLASGFRELLNYVEELERDGRAPHAGHRRPITNYIRKFDAGRMQATKGDHK